jgi:fructan beta-fructosidase
MAVAAGTVILFYTSPDLIHWDASGGFGFGYGSSVGVWETPDLFELPLDGGPATRWVLSVGVGDGGPTGGSGTQYFVGRFDGQNFTSENPPDTILWADFGADFYAAQSWSDAPGGRRVWLAWMNNWRYAQDIPTSTWRGAFTLPRDLSLVTTPDGIRLLQRPVPELQALRGQRQTWPPQTITSATPYAIEAAQFEISVEFQVTPNMEADRLGLRLLAGDGRPTTIGYTTKSHTLFVERAECGQTRFSPAFAGVHLAQLEPRAGVIRLHIFIDSASVEVFGNGGEVVLTDQIFPCPGSIRLELFADGGAVQLNSLTVFGLNAAQFYLPSQAGP